MLSLSSNAQHGILLGDPVDGHFMVYITADGGQTCNATPRTDSPPPSPTKALLRQQFVPRRRGYEQR